LTFKLRPLPRASSTIIVSAAAGELTNFAAELMSAPLSPVAVEILSPALVLKLEVGDDPVPVIAVRYAGNQEAVAFQLNETLAMSRRFSSEQSLLDGSDEAPLWNALSEQAAGELSGREWRAAFKPLDLLNFVKADSGSTLLERSEWHAGVYDGRLCVNQSGDSPHSDFSMLSERIKAAGGHIVSTGSFDIASQTGAPGLTRRIKEQFDPAGLFSPERFVR
jgi:glycolate oxidase FAD binding subunit